MAGNPYLPSYAQIAPGAVQPIPIGIQPIQGAQQLANQPLPTLPAPQFQNLSDLQDQVDRFAPGPVDTSPTSFAGGVARMVGGWAQGWAEHRAKEKLDSARQDNAKLLAGLLKNGGLSSPDAAVSMVGSPDPTTENLGLGLLIRQSEANAYRPMTAQEKAQYGIPANSSAQIDSSGKVSVLDTGAGKAPPTRQAIRGGQFVTEQWDGTKWVALPGESGSRWNPKQSTANDSNAAFGGLQNPATMP